MKRLIVTIPAVLAAALIGWRLWSGHEVSAENYRWAELTRGDLERSVSSTGTLYPVSLVEVGTQVSGTIAEVLVDFNDRVEVGQLLAILDKTYLKAALLETEAGVDRARAQLSQDETEYDRSLKLHERGLISDEELEGAKVNVDLQKASLKSAEAAWERARANLGYATICSPISGTVIERNVEAGQTVAASLSTPTLFVIAEDLDSMEIHAKVDESDIGEVKKGQAVRFTVQAYPDETFSGTVSEIRLQPANEQNVVNYTVVVDVPNDRGMLLPGMTATADFIVERKEDVLLVSNAALRVQPSPEMLEQARENGSTGNRAAKAQVRDPNGAAGLSLGSERGEAGVSEKRPAAASENAKNLALLWYKNGDGDFAVARVRTGSTNGKVTEIVAGDDVREGMMVLAGINSQGTSETAAFASPPPGGPGMRRGLF